MEPGLLDSGATSAAEVAPETDPRAFRDWWLRTLLVLQHPRPVFAALRDDSREAAGERSEQVLLIVLLSGIAYALATPTASHLMDDGTYDGVLVAIWAFFAGGIVGGFAYFLLGGLLYAGVKVLGSQGSYRRARHVVAFASVPLALSLVLVPVRLALYGDAIFRTGGADAGSGGHVFTVLELGFVTWAAALLVGGVRAVHGWTWARAGSAVLLALLFAFGISVGLAVAAHLRG